MMKLLEELLYDLNIESIIGPTNISISSIYFNSSDAIKQGLFFAIKGKNTDGHNFIEEAISKGSIAILCEDIPEKCITSITYIQVKKTSFALGIISSNFFNQPSKKLKLVGVTGTNGKTSTVHYLFSLFQQLNFKVGLISTINNKIQNKTYSSTHTTPNPIKINELLSDMVNAGCNFCFMEVSSHGILQNRISGLDFDIGVFTNISRDHLDYHKSFNSYLYTKKKFFDQLKGDAVAVINNDDPHASTITLDIKSKKVFFSTSSPAHYNASIMESSINGLHIKIDDYELSTKLVGEFNIYNILATYSVALELQQDKLSILPILSNIDFVQGRFNIVKNSDITAVVDYAHTPDALKQVILSISNFCETKKHLIIVIGCGGDRDVGKRSIMGKIAAENSILPIFTSDNPRFEDPKSIINEMCRDLSENLNNKVQRIINREEAIRFAISQTSKQSIILVAGKGHEAFQDTNGVKKPFDDLKILKKLLKI